MSKKKADSAPARKAYDLDTLLRQAQLLADNPSAVFSWKASLLPEERQMIDTWANEILSDPVGAARAALEAVIEEAKAQEQTPKLELSTH